MFGDRAEPSQYAPKPSDEAVVAANTVDNFLAKTTSITALWLPGSAIAATSVTVTIDGRAVTVGGNGTFATRVSPGLHQVVATDATGARTGLLLS
jgi:hypothetical protein